MLEDVLERLARDRRVPRHFLRLLKWFEWKIRKTYEAGYQAGYHKAAGERLPALETERLLESMIDPELTLGDPPEAFCSMSDTAD